MTGGVFLWKGKHMSVSRLVVVECDVVYSSLHCYSSYTSTTDDEDEARNQARLNAGWGYLEGTDEDICSGCISVKPRS